MPDIAESDLIHSLDMTAANLRFDVNSNDVDKHISNMDTGNSFNPTKNTSNVISQKTVGFGRIYAQF